MIDWRLQLNCSQTTVLHVFKDNLCRKNYRCSNKVIQILSELIKKNTERQYLKVTQLPTDVIQYESKKKSPLRRTGAHIPEDSEVFYLYLAMACLRPVFLALFLTNMKLYLHRTVFQREESEMVASLLKASIDCGTVK